VTSAPGARPQESAGRLINAYAVKTEQGARGPLKWLRAPGLRELANVNGRAGYRGFIEIDDNVLAVLEDRAVLIAKSGSTVSVTDLGALDGARLVTVAKNNATPVADIVAVTEEGAFNLYIDDVPDDFADADLPQPNSVSGVKGYFAFTIADGRLFASNLNSVNVNALSYTTAPGRLLRGVSYRDEWFVFGDNFCQVYRDAGLTPFPFDLVATIPIGLAGTHAIAGWEPGFTGTMAWAAQDDVVYRLSGYTPQAVSTEDVSRDIAATPDKSALEAAVHMSNGNAFWVLTRPGFWSWTLNLTTGTWGERASYDQESWRAARTVRAFSTWLAGDRGSGRLFEIGADVFREGDDPLVFEVVSGAVLSSPNRLAVGRLDVDMVAAVGRAAGEENEADPQVEISWSLDGGYRWSNPVFRAIGREGCSRKTISVNRLGLAGPKGIMIRLRVSDPVHVTLFGAALTLVEQRAPK
jgi:hypothetical protein